jgi:hypothetical protein
VKLENSFEVPASRQETWQLLNDVPRVVPCMPGAQLDEVVDDDNFKVTMHVKMGPIALQFATEIHREAEDVAAGTTVLSAKAREVKGRGAATARIESTLEEAGEGTKVSIVTDLQLQGAVASTGRGIVPDVATQLVKRFADCIASQLQAEEAPPAEAAPADAPAPEAAPAPAGAEAPEEPGAEAAAPAAAPAPAATPAPASTPPVAPKVEPVGGFGLVLRALWAKIKRLFGRG